MNKIIYLALCLLAFSSCKKEESTSTNGTLKIIVSGVTTGNYTISLEKKGTTLSSWGVSYKTENTTYETPVTKGDEYTVLTSFYGPCNVEFMYNGHSIGSAWNTGTGNNRTTSMIHIL